MCDYGFNLTEILFAGFEPVRRSRLAQFIAEEFTLLILLFFYTIEVFYHKESKEFVPISNYGFSLSRSLAVEVIVAYGF